MFEQDPFLGLDQVGSQRETGQSIADPKVEEEVARCLEDPLPRVFQVRLHPFDHQRVLEH
jgi:hypothetical protein